MDRLARVLCAVAVVAGCRDRAPAARATFVPEALPRPSDDELQREIDAALAKKHREDADRALDAADPGELFEHATVLQITLDRGRTTLADLLRIGDDLFALQLRPEHGLGNALAGHAGIAAGSAARPNLRHAGAGELGGPDAIGCTDCHAVGGDDGAGSPSQVSLLRSDGDSSRAADARTAPGVLGLGPIQRLAIEMTADLQRARDDAIARAAATGAPVSVALASKGVAFGALIAAPDGSVDVAGVRGVSPDLIVRPFGWKGHQATLRAVVREEFRQHLGMIAMADQVRVRDGAIAATDFGDGPWYDLDADGPSIEVDDGSVTAMAAYLAQLEAPVIVPPADPILRARFERGRAVFGELGCASCHVPSLPLASPVLVEAPEEPAHAGGAAFTIDVSRDGMQPKAPRDVPLFSDLKRHDLGDGLRAPVDQALGDHVAGPPIARGTWLTRPLWGLADSGPYLHDGHAITIADAIRDHGGEAAASAAAFAAAAPSDRAALQVFLLSLRRTPYVVAP